MKQSIIPIAILLTAWACSYIVEEEESNLKSEMVKNFTAIAHDSYNNGARTVLNEDFSLTWEESDQIGMLSTSSMDGNYQMVTEESKLYENNTIAEFSTTSPIPADSYILYYPYQQYTPRENYPFPIATSVTFNGSDIGYIAQQDILYSQPVIVDNENKSANITFNHLNTAFNFNIKLTKEADIKIESIKLVAAPERGSVGCTTEPFLRACHIELNNGTPKRAHKTGYETNLVEINFTPTQTLSSTNYINVPMIVAWEATIAPPVNIVIKTDKGYYTIEKSATNFIAGNVYNTTIELNPDNVSSLDPLREINGEYSVDKITLGDNGNINNLASTVISFEEYSEWVENVGGTYNSAGFKALDFDYCIGTHGGNLLYPLCFKISDTETSNGSGKFGITCLAVVEPGNTTQDLGSYYEIESGIIVLYFSNGGSTYKFELTPISGEHVLPGEDGGKGLYLSNSVISNFAPWFTLQNADLTNDTSYFSLQRSRRSENLIIFWEKGFGSDPTTCNDVIDGVSMQVDIDDMLTKMEAFYDIYANDMAFVVKGLSNTDKYLMPIYLFYTSGWIANGGGNDDKMGAFWISPSACHPIGQTVAHELGHSFQYQVGRDDPAGKAGYQHAIGEGNSFWEITANYQSWKTMVVGDYALWNSEVPYYQANAHRGFFHEWLRYQNFFILNYWESIHGRDLVGRLWRESVPDEDPVETYKRITNTDQTTLNNEMWTSACKECTWDFEMKEQMQAMVENHAEADRNTWLYDKNDLVYNTYDGFYRPSHDPSTSDPGVSLNRAFCPQSYGRNIISLDVPEAGTTLTVDFRGLTGYESTADNAAYRYNNENAGWRWGFVACTGDNGWTPVYGDINSSSNGSAQFTVPENTKRLYLVVMGAPTTHIQKTWDSNVTNDYEYPYRFKIDGTTVNATLNTITNEELTTDEEPLPTPEPEPDPEQTPDVDNGKNVSAGATINSFTNIVM